MRCRMNLMIYPNFVDHLVFRVEGIERTERFYSALLGQPYKSVDSQPGLYEKEKSA